MNITTASEFLVKYCDKFVQLCYVVYVGTQHNYNEVKLISQILYSPTHVEGIGLSDGEVMERLWSELRRYSRMTKEIRPSHRVDVLSHALLHYGHKTKLKQCEYEYSVVCVYLSYLITLIIASLLASRWKKAYEIHMEATKTFSSL